MKTNEEEKRFGDAPARLPETGRRDRALFAAPARSREIRPFMTVTAPIAARSRIS